MREFPAGQERLVGGEISRRFFAAGERRDPRDFAFIGHRSGWRAKARNGLLDESPHTVQLPGLGELARHLDAAVQVLKDAVI
jgi:hypothetical protein